MKLGAAVALPLVATALTHTTSSNISFAFPKGFEGLWKGVPQSSVLGPWENELVFSITKAQNGDYLLEDNMKYGSNAKNETGTGWQRFYVEGSGATSGSLWYCGVLSNFADATEETGMAYQDLFKVQTFPRPTDTNVTFCFDPTSPYQPFPTVAPVNCTGCACAQWTLSLQGSTLTSEMVVGGSTHLSVTFDRAGPAPPVTFPMPGHGSKFSCDYKGRDGKPIVRSTCPYLHRPMRAKAPLGSTALAAQPPPRSKLTHCYDLNYKTGYRLEWTLDKAVGVVHVAISASGDDKYVAVGFRPLGRVPSPLPPRAQTGRHFKFGMMGADIAYGSTKHGVSTAYASEFVGTPTTGFLHLTNTSVTSVDGRTTVRFTRPLIDGRLASLGMKENIVSPAADIIWAVGSSDSSSGLNYHGATRGLRFIDWEHPEIAMSQWQCA
jgi:hypothetical protein